MAARNTVLGSIAAHVICIILFATTGARAATVRITPDRPSPQWAGTTVRWTATASDCTGPCSFKWWLDSGTGKVLVQDWSTTAGWSWTPTVPAAGYRITVWVRGADNTEDRDEADTNDLYDVVERPRVTSVRLTADKPSPQPVGTTITVTAAPSGGVPPYSYKWQMYTGTSWVALQDWSSAATYGWTPMLANLGLRLFVRVRSAGNTSSAEEASTNVQYAIGPAARANRVTVTPESPSPQYVGRTLQFTAAASGGTSPYSYRWSVDDGTGPRVVQDWGSATLQWRPTATNASYTVSAAVRSSGNLLDDAETTAAVPFAIVDPPPIDAVALVSSPQSPQAVTTPIRFTATPSGGIGPYSYRWWLYHDSNWTLMRDYTSDPTWTWLPETPDRAYGVRVDVHGALDRPWTAPVSNAMSFTITVPRVTAVTLTSDLAPPQKVGTSVTFTAAATGGTAPLTFRWWVHDGSVWQPLRGWSTSPQLVWNPPVPGANYHVVVWARSAGNIMDVPEASDERPYAIEAGRCPVTVSTSTVAVGSGEVGGTLQVTAPADCAWQARSRASWLTLMSQAAGTGSARIAYRVGANPLAAARDTTLDIGTARVAVVQAGRSDGDGCSSAVYPSSVAVGAANQAVSIAVTAPPGCRWTSDASAGFLRAGPVDGVGSGSVTLQVENNTAAEPRLGSILIAGRAVSVTQSGVETTGTACVSGVSPRDITAGAGGGTGVLDVAAPAGCAWSVGSSASYLRPIGATSGTGPGQVAYALDPNGGGARTAALVVGGSGVTVTQAAAPATPACAYALSTSGVTLSHAGGTAAVGVTTAPGCPWDIDVRTSWARIVQRTGPAGGGTVWLAVDANTGESTRLGTLVIAGQSLTLTQAAPPVTVSADAITWHVTANPDRVGQCEGNCGAGCGTFFNPCGGPHYWEHRVLSPPQYVGDDWEPVCANGSEWIAVRPRYTALARWTYHGLRSSNCAAHDASCRALNLIPFLPADKVLCLATAGVVGLNGLTYCADAEPFDWSYDFVDVGHGAAVSYVDGGGACN